MNTPAEQIASCPDCGATLVRGEAKCWLCKRVVGHEAGETSAASSVPPRPTQPRADVHLGQFSLSSLMLIVTLVAVCLGATLAAPGLGIGLIVLATPALIRSLVIGWQRKAVGQRLSTGEKALAFIVSLAVMFAIAVAGFIAFEIACWGSCAAAAAVAGEGGEAIGFGIIFGGVVAIGLIGWLLWRTRPRRPRARL